MLEKYKELSVQILEAIEKSNNDNPACKNCKNYDCDGTCVLNCVNERNGIAYRFGNRKVTTPNYSCGNFSSKYNFSQNTIDNLKDIIEDAQVLDSKLVNFKSLLDGKLSEEDFNELVK